MKIKKFISMFIICTMFISVFSVDVLAAESYLSGGQLLKSYVVESGIFDCANTSTEFLAHDDVSVSAAYLQKFVESNSGVRQIYGGCYIDDGGNLRVLVTKNTSKSSINDINIITRNRAIYEECNYALDELIALKEYINQRVLECNSTIQNIDVVSIGIYEQYNRITIGIKECSQEKIEIFKKNITNSKAVQFENAENYDYCVNINAGSGIRIGTSSNTAGGYSVGFRCRYLRASGEYIYGFMTAGHNNAAGEFAFVGQTQIGYVAGWSHNNNSTVDNAFVYVNNSNYTTTNTMIASAGTLVAGAYTTTYTTGATIYKVGNTTNLTSGKITSTSYQYTFSSDGLTKKDLVQVATGASGGDSGCTVYRKVNGSNYITGTCQAGTENSLLFVKINNIKDVFNITLY